VVILKKRGGRENKNFMNTTCIICDADVSFPKDVEESEVITCSDCKSRLVVEKIDRKKVILAKAPDVEEDWGE